MLEWWWTQTRVETKTRVERDKREEPGVIRIGSENTGEPEQTMVEQARAEYRKCQDNATSYTGGEE